MTPSRPEPEVAWTTEGDTAYLARVPHGPIVVLTGPAVIIWDELAANGDLATLVGRVTARIINAPNDIDAVVQQVVARLRTEGLLAPIAGGDFPRSDRDT